MFTPSVLCSPPTVRSTPRLSVDCFYLLHHLFPHSLRRLKLIMSHRKGYFGLSDLLPSLLQHSVNNLFFSFLCERFTLKILRMQSFPRISDSGL